MKRFFQLFFICVVFFAATIEAQAQRITTASSTLNEDRTIQVLLPESYAANPNATYPVIYLLDGDYNFNAVSGMLDMLANKGELIPNVILVAIADKGTQSYRSFMTPSFNEQKTSDNATKFATYLPKK